MPLDRQAQEQYASRGYTMLSRVFTSEETQRLGIAAEAAERRVWRELVSANEYWLDGKRFADIGHVTVQFEHGNEQSLVDEQQISQTNICSGGKSAKQDDALRVRVIEPINDFESTFDALLDDPRLVAPMQQLVGERRLSLWTAKLNFKSAGTGSGFGWHQDSPYWIHDSNHVHLLPNVLVALDDADATNGCLRVVPGSHLHGILPGCTDQRQLAGFYTDPKAFDESAAVDLAVPAGSCIFFHPHLVHGSKPNYSKRQRRALVATYQPAGFPALKSGAERRIRRSIS